MRGGIDFLTDSNEAIAGAVGMLNLFKRDLHA